MLNSRCALVYFLSTKCFILKQLLICKTNLPQYYIHIFHQSKYLKTNEWNYGNEGYLGF